MWFAAFQHPFQNEWLIRFALKMIENDRNVSTLIEENPFSNGMLFQRILARGRESSRRYKSINFVPFLDHHRCVQMELAQSLFEFNFTSTIIVRYSATSGGKETGGVVRSFLPIIGRR